MAVAIEHTRLVEAAKLAEVAQMMGDITHDIKNLLMPVVCGAGILQAEINELLDHLPDIEVKRAKASRELRITSYNVCYTKLLRTSKTISLYV